MKSFTLVETVVTISIFIILIVGLLGAILLLYQTHGYQWEQSLAIEEAKRGIEVMAKEIREAREGENGAYPIEYAGDKEFIFYSDIDNDGKAEKVRYFLGMTGSGSQAQECVSFADGGSCSVTFFDFLTGILKSSQVTVSLEGDFGSNQEYAEIYADGVYLGRICQDGCLDCAEIWQGTQIFDVATQAADDSIQFIVDTSSRVDNFCDWEQPNHSMKAKFEFSWTEELVDLAHKLKKGVIKPVGDPPTYPLEQEKISILSSYVRNAPPIFEYFDSQGNKITDYPARLKDTKVIKVFLVVNVDPNRPPIEYQLDSYVQLRNLKE